MEFFTKEAMKEEIAKEIENEENFIYVSEKTILFQNEKNISHCCEKLLASAIANLMREGELDYLELLKANDCCFDIAIKKLEEEIY